MGSNNKGQLLKKLDRNPWFSIKLFGDFCTGKSCLSKVFEKGVYKEYSEAFDVYHKKLTVHNIATNVFIWDHPGQKILRNLVYENIPGSDGIFLLYDVTNIQTFLNLPEWLKTMRSLNPGAIIFIIGAKSDIIDKKVVSSETGLNFARSEKLEFFECSAKTGENVNYVLEQMVLRLLQKKGVLPFDQIEGKSHEHQDTKEKVNSAVSEKEILYASITERNISTSITRKEIIKIEENMIPVEDTLKNLKEGKFLSKIETDCLGLEKVDATDITKGNDNIPSQTDKDTSSEQNGAMQPEAKKFALSDEEMQFEGRCPAWFA